MLHFFEKSIKSFRIDAYLDIGSFKISDEESNQNSRCQHALSTYIIIPSDILMFLKWLKVYIKDLKNFLAEARQVSSYFDSPVIV